MEIQFSIPLARGKDQPAESSSTATSQSAGTAPARGGTHRFALESRTRHTRRSSARARTGCNTCKKRHLKCDETLPSCLKCMKWRGYCDGYGKDDPESQPSRTYQSQAQLIHTKKAPLILTEPPVNTIRFSTSDQRAYFDEWTGLSIFFLSGGLGQTKLWTTTMPQVTLEEKTLRYAAMAVGALRKSYRSDGAPGVPDETSRAWRDAIVYYCEALRLQSQAKLSREGLRTALLASLMFICFETLRGNMPAALKHIVHGFSMLNELAACSDAAPNLVSIAPAPPALVQEILDCYKPLELQSRSFMGSYSKHFFNAAQHRPAIATPPGPNPQGQVPQNLTPPSVVNQETSYPSPPSQTGSPWNASAAQQHPTGLPSPQSQNSQGGRTPPTGPPAPPPRPPHIAPFTKHSPYFKPKKSSITSLDEMPRVFETLDQAQDYWALVQRYMVQYVPVLTRMTAQLGLTKTNSDEVLNAKLDSVRQNPKISSFVAESRYWLQRWIEALEPYSRAATQNAHIDRDAYLRVCNIRIEYLILYIYTAVPRYSGLITSKGLTPQYREINALAETLLNARPSCGFAMDSGWTWPIFVAAFGCRDRAVREDAIRILGQYPTRNALRDSRVFRAIALKNHEIELLNTQWGDEHDQWLRLRRRELVFEDFGASIIFRFSQRDPVTGQWILVEEVADFEANAQGTLTWRRQPISESLSILSGVC